jgi:adenine-specific DNA glycosylase
LRGARKKSPGRPRPGRGRKSIWSWAWCGAKTNGRWCSGGLYGGLWEFPGTGVSGDQKGEDVLRRFLAGLGLTVRLTGKLETISHILSHRELRLHPWLCEDAGGEDGLSPIPEGGWFSAGEIKSMAVSSLTRRLAARAESAGKSLVRA